MALEQKVFKKTRLINEKIRKIDNFLLNEETEVRSNKNIIDSFKFSFNYSKKILKI